MTAPVIHVVAALITDPVGRLLLVRKHGTDRFMQAGGKPEGDEPLLDALIRELHEELGLRVDAHELRPRGAFSTRAANEPGHLLEATVWSLRLDGRTSAALAPHAELAELRWTTPEEAAALGDRLAPLARLLLP